MTPRIISRLDIKGPNLVKGIHLEGLRVMGKPEQFAQFYYENGADELLYIDIVASLYGRNSLLHIINSTSRKHFIPLTVGGGLRTLDDIRDVLKAGADKVALNTAALQDPEIIAKGSKTFGSSTIVVSIEAIKRPNGTYECYTNNGREPTGRDAFEWAAECERLGAGEILVTSIDNEGTGKGFDLVLTRKISESATIPVIACGGAGKKEDVLAAFAEGGADAVSLASVLHYHFIREHQSDLEGFEEGNTNFLKSSQSYSQVQALTIQEIKGYLGDNRVLCRTET